MRLDVYLPLALTAVFGITGPNLARRLPPAVATWLLSLGGAVCAAASTAAMAFLGWTLVAQAPDVAARGHWSTAALRTHDPVATPVAVVALVVLGVVVLRAVLATVRRSAALVSAHRLATTLPTGGGQLVVVDDDSLPACAIPGRPGRIVVPASLLRSLDAAGRRAVLEHERAHLAHHHHAHHAAAQLAAAANPLLARIPTALALATERWADEEAAHRTPRAAVARALARASRAHRLQTPAGALNAARNDLLTRMAALSVPPPRLDPWRVATLTAVVVVALLATLDAAHDTEGLFELAMRAYRPAG